MPLFSKNATARAAATAAGTAAFYPAAERYAQGMTPKLLRMIRDDATTGLPDAVRYSKLSLTFGEEVTGNTHAQDAHALQKTQGKALNHCRKFDMADIFLEFPKLDFSTPNTPDYDNTTSPTMDLFTSYDSITVEQVATTISYIRMWSEDDLFKRLQDDLAWSAIFFLRSCSAAGDLEDEVHDTYNSMVATNPLVAGGPLVLRIILDKIARSDAVTLDALASSFKTIKIAGIPGENVELLCKQLRCFLERLSLTKKLPNLLETTLCDIFQTSSTSSFNDTFKSKRQLLLEEPSKYSWKDLLTSAKTIYSTMHLLNEWNSTNSDADSFFQIDSRRRGNRHDNNNNNNHNNDGARDTDSVRESPLFIYPNPQKGDRKISDDPKRWVKELNGEEVHWCGKCNQGNGRWTNGTRRHFTDEHRGRGGNARANLVGYPDDASATASIPPPPTITTPGPTSTSPPIPDANSGSFSAALTRLTNST